MVVIGDIAGQFKGLMALVAKLPSDAEIVLVGDIIDRGPQSKEVVQWAMSTPRVKTLKGNHEDMMVDHVRRQHRYENGIWFMNGGWETMKSYGFPDKGDMSDKTLLEKHFPEEHIKWMEDLPLFIETDNLFISHAPTNMYLTLDGTKKLPLANGLSLVWNRDVPPILPEKLQLFGHNSNWGLRKFVDNTKSPEPYAICLDDSQHDKLTAYNTETKEIIQQPYLD